MNFIPNFVFFILKIFVTLNRQVSANNICMPNEVGMVDYPGYTDCREFSPDKLANSMVDMLKKTPEILQGFGLPFKEYLVNTKDGYILTVYRIMGPTNTWNRRHNTPVYINHGLFGDSNSWFLPSNRSLVFKLVQEGYDVWLSNTRGTLNSLGHEKLKHNSTDDFSYWNFSFHEMGIHDIPAVTDKIIAESKRHKILYLGYSMGTTPFFVALSELPEMNDKIRGAFLLAPLAFVGHAPNVLRRLSKYLDIQDMYQLAARSLGGRIKNNEDLKHMFRIPFQDVCSFSAAKCGLCGNIWFALFGVNAPQTSSATAHLLDQLAPVISLKTLSHIVQLMNTCQFQQFSTSRVSDLASKTPSYPLLNVRTPLHFYYGEQDNFVVPADVQELALNLRKGVLQKNYVVGDRLFNHLDFMTAKDVDKLVYDEVIKDMEKYRRLELTK